MPLPRENTAWPPASHADIFSAMETWDAWYAGDPERLARTYGSQAATETPTRPSQFSGGLVGKASRFFWGRPIAPDQRSTNLHIPLASDIAAASADLLYSDPPTFSVDSPDESGRVQGRLEAYMEEAMQDELVAGAEIGAALGGRFHRVTWDHEVVPDSPFLTTVHCDAALPEFRFGRLVAVTFWTVVEKHGGTVLRHLERHELDNGIGVVEHALYEGTGDNLGRRVPLTEHHSVEHLAVAVDGDSRLRDGRTPGLMVAYVANRMPQRKWRTHAVGRHLGRSDYDSLEGLFDQLDEVWSSWMRDIRLGRARILIARSMLEDRGPGQGASFDADREVFTPLDGTLPTIEDSSLPIDQVQFAIRVDEHRKTAREILDQIVRQAGYSTGTFGEAHDGDMDITATEVEAREKRSLMTRDRKIRSERPALASLARKMLSIDREVFKNTDADPDADVTVTFPDAVQDTDRQRAQAVSLLASAGAISTEMKVRMARPEWDDDQIGEEVARIRDESDVLDPGSLRLRPGGESVPTVSAVDDEPLEP